MCFVLYIVIQFSITYILLLYTKLQEKAIFLKNYRYLFKYFVVFYENFVYLKD